MQSSTSLQLSNRQELNRSLEEPLREKNSNIDFDRVNRLRLDLKPLTLPYRDSVGRILQLWNSVQYGLIGVVVSQNDVMTIIHANKIVNALNQFEKGNELLCRLQKISVKKWDIVFDLERSSLLIWPHLEAAGKYDGKTGEETLIDVKKRLTTVQEKGALNSDHYRAAQKESKGLLAIINPKDGEPFDHRNDVRESVKAARNIIRDIKIRLRKFDLTYQDRRKLEEFIWQVGKVIDDSYRFAPSVTNYKPPGKGSNRSQLPAKNPAKKQFHETLNKTGLVDSYNSSHPDSPAPKGTGGGEIGGVGCAVELIGGLFDSPESLFERKHSFFIPEFQGEEIPFTSQEMCQILHELTRGIYIHETVPFFSLHFTGDKNAYPVIHPAYENTLVGQVFSLLDYFMKGYTNGGVFTESFLKKWQASPFEIKDTDRVWQELIDIGAYVRLNLKGEDQTYSPNSFRLKSLELDFDEKTEQFSRKQKVTTKFNFYDYTKFNNSFRIIAKQKSIEKTEDLFRINSDFEVLYTIEPDPDYKDALDDHLLNYGQYPEAYLNLVKSYEEMKGQIHDHMVKLPFAKKYFAMLGVINFFCYYLTTLKKHRKMPVLPDVALVAAQCPALFPPLPYLTIREEEININRYKVFEKFIKEKSWFIQWYLFSDLLGPPQGLIDRAKERIEEICWEQILENSSSPLRRAILAKKDELRTHCKQIAADLNLLGILKENFDRVPHSVIWNRPWVESYYPFIDQFSQRFRENYDHPIALMKLMFKAFVLPSEKTTQEALEGKKIFGGCGMNVTPIKLEPSSVSQTLLEHHWLDIQETPAGEWTVIRNQEKSVNGVVFTLPFIDIPLSAIGNSADVEMLLTSIDDKLEAFFDQMHAIVESIAENDEQEFVRLIADGEVKTMVDFDQRSLLHHSAMFDNLFFTKELLRRGGLVTAKDQKYYLPIHYAAMSGQVPQLAILIKQNARTIEAENNQGATPLIVAIQHRQSSAVEFLLSEGASVGAKLHDGYTVVHCAVQQGDVRIIQMVLSSLQDNYMRHSQSSTNDDLAILNAMTEEGLTPLMIACRQGLYSAVDLLIKAGANVNQKSRKGVSALEIAVEMNRLDLCQLLSKREIPNLRIIDIAIKRCSLEINLLLAGLSNYFTYVNCWGDTPLLIAIKYANIPVALHILSRAAGQKQIDAKNRFGETPILLAIKGKFYSLVAALLIQRACITPFELFKLLLAYGYTGQDEIVNGYLKVHLSDSELQDLTLTAAKNGNYVGISNLLVIRRVDLSRIKGERGWGIDHFLAKFDGIFLFRMRQQQIKNLRLALEQEEGKTLAYIAGENGSLRVLEYLLTGLRSSHALFSRDYKRRQLFYGVLESGFLDGIKLFVSKMQNLEFLNQPVDELGTFPVHVAAKYCRREVAEFLHLKGARFSVLDSFGHYPLFYAVERNDKNLVNFLLEDKHAIPVTADVLYAAATLKSDKILKNLILKGADVNYRDNLERNSAVFLAIMKGDLSSFLRLVHNDASLVLKNRDGWTPLLLACNQGQRQMVEVILARNPEGLLDKIKGNNALHIACYKGFRDCAEILIKEGLDPNEENFLGQTAFYFAQHEFGVAALLDHDNLQIYQDFIDKINLAIKEKRLSSLLDEFTIWQVNSFFHLTVEGSSFGGTLLQIVLRWFACDEMLHEMIRRIVTTPGFNRDLRDLEGNSYAHLMISKKVDPTLFKVFNLEMTNNKGQNPLHIAAMGESKEILAKLVEELPKSLESVDHLRRTPLFYAINTKRTENVGLLLGNRVNVNHRDCQGITPLIVACKRMDYPTVRLLVDYHADVNKNSIKGLTPLSVSLESDHDEISLFLIFNGAKLTSVGIDGRQIAHHAASRGKIYLLRFLFEQKVSLSPIDQNGLQPIHCAAISGKTDIIEYYTSLGVSLETTTSSTERAIESNYFWNGATAFFWASMCSNLETVKWILDHQIKPRLIIDSGLNIFSAALENTPLHCSEIFQLFQQRLLVGDLKEIFSTISLAISKDYVEPLRLLYQMGIPLDADIGEGFTALHYACLHGARFSTEFLLKHGVKEDLLSASGEIPLELAASNRSVEQFKLMLDYTTPNFDYRNQKGETLMHLSAQAGNLSHIMLLIERGFELDVQDFQGKTPLHFAAAKGSKEIVKLLMIFGANPEVRTFYHLRRPEDSEDTEMCALIVNLKTLILEIPKGSTPLHIASKLGESLILRLAIYQFNVNQKNCLGRTALHEALEHGSLENVRLLLNAGADVNMQDNEGMSPLAIAHSKPDHFNSALSLLRAKELKMLENR